MAKIGDVIVFGGCAQPFLVAAIVTECAVVSEWLVLEVLERCEGERAFRKTGRTAHARRSKKGKYKMGHRADGDGRYAAEIIPGETVTIVEDMPCGPDGDCM